MPHAVTYNGTALHFSYDVNGYPLSLVYGGNTYYYATNLQGDVVAILDSTGAAVVTYLGYSAAMNTLSGLLSFGINITFASATAFVYEYMKMAKYNFDFGGVLINKIMSPGFKIFSLWL
jgi:hypothetical protein